MLAVVAMAIGCGSSGTPAMPDAPPAPLHTGLFMFASGRGPLAATSDHLFWLGDHVMGESFAETPAISYGAAVSMSQGIAVDDHNVYWADADSKTIYSAPLSGGNATQVVTTQQSAQELFVAGGFLFWIERASSSNALMTVATTGGTPTAVEGSFSIGGIAADASNVYYGSALGIHKVAFTGGNFSDVVETNDVAESIVVSGGTVYWSTYNGAIASAPAAGGAETKLASDILTAHGLALRDGQLYWVAQDDRASTTDASVMKMPVTGGTPATVVDHRPFGLGTIVAGPTYLYWDEPNAIMGIPR
jgi:hypothetical protein